MIVQVMAAKVKILMMTDEDLEHEPSHLEPVSLTLEML